MKWKNGITGFKAADICIKSPEIFTEIEFEENEKTMANNESKRDDDATTAVTTQVNTQMWSHLNYNLVLPEL